VGIVREEKADGVREEVRGAKTGINPLALRSLSTKELGAQRTEPGRVASERWEISNIKRRRTPQTKKMSLRTKKSFEECRSRQKGAKKGRTQGYSLPATKKKGAQGSGIRTVPAEAGKQKTGIFKEVEIGPLKGLSKAHHK